MPLLFSYGTLQLPSVQVSTFGRRLHAEADQLVGFEQSTIDIDDPAFVAASGQRQHAIVRFTGRNESRVPGMVLDVTDEELARADAYEPAGYVRVRAPLVSGREAWVYAGVGSR